MGLKRPHFVLSHNSSIGIQTHDLTIIRRGATIRHCHGFLVIIYKRTAQLKRCYKQFLEKIRYRENKAL